jgi:hypothetical protein
MFGQQSKPDKVNMSLDAIIKLNKKQNKPQQNAARQSNFNKKPNTFNKNKNNQQNRVQGQGQVKKRQGKDQFQNQQVNKKPFGILNRSRSIKKNKNNQNNNNDAVFTPKQNKNNIQQQKGSGGQFNRRRPRPVQAQFVGNRRRPVQKNNQNQVKRVGAAPRNNQFNRFGQKSPLKQQQQAVSSQITIINPAPIKSASPRKNNIIQKVGVTQRVRIGQNQRQQIQKRKTAGNFNIVNKSKIAMQSARKNVQKAKRLLVARKHPVRQLMTKHYASKIGLTTSKIGLTKPQVRIARPLQQPRKNNIVKNKIARNQKPKMLSISIANKGDKVQKQQKPVQIKKAAVPQIKKPILNRTRPLNGLAGTTSSRMVFY